MMSAPGRGGGGDAGGKAASVGVPVKAAVAIVAAAIALAWALWVRELPASFSAVVAVAFGVLALMAVRAFERLRSISRRRPPPGV